MFMKDKLTQLGIKTYQWAAFHHTFAPRSILVETTKACNLRCPGCRRNYASGSLFTEPGAEHLDAGALWRIIATTPVQVLRFEGDGEPLMNPYFKELLQFLKQKGVRSMMTSNGTLLDERWVKVLEENGMARVHVSFDAATKDTYEEVKLGADFEKTLHNCKLLGKSKVQLFMNVVLFSDAVVEELPKYVEQAMAVGATGIHYMKMQSDGLDFGNPPNLTEHQGTIKRFNELTKKAGLTVAGTCSDQPTFVECYDPYINPFVILNNDVYACTYMANLRRAEVYRGEVLPVPYQNYKMGNLEDNWMKDIWKNKAYKDLRQTLKATRKPNGYTTSPDTLLEAKRDMVYSPIRERFSFCNACLCRWGESGL